MCHGRPAREGARPRWPWHILVAAPPRCATLTNQIQYFTVNGVNTNYTYDQAGDVTADGTNTYQWDAEGRLTAVVNSGTTISANTYNAGSHDTIWVSWVLRPFGGNIRSCRMCIGCNLRTESSLSR